MNYSIGARLVQCVRSVLACYTIKINHILAGMLQTKKSIFVDFSTSFRKNTKTPEFKYKFRRFTFFLNQGL